MVAGTRLQYISRMADPWLTSTRLPVPHGFTTREGGVSEGPFASLNLSFAVGDARAAVEENARRLVRTAGLTRGLATVSQVHGDRVFEACAGADPLTPLGEADALICGEPGAAIGVRIADCVPILLRDPQTGWVAAVHSGWRGTDLEISARAVEALLSKGARAERLVAAIGPSIRACCYEVSEELASRFTAKFGVGVVTRPAGKPHLDLVAAIEQSLARAGVRAENVERVAPCASCDARFFSHRRDHGRTGRMLAFIAAG
jgi:YfiH family protein